MLVRPSKVECSCSTSSIYGLTCLVIRNSILINLHTLLRLLKCKILVHPCPFCSTKKQKGCLNGHYRLLPGLKTNIYAFGIQVFSNRRAERLPLVLLRWILPLQALELLYKNQTIKMSDSEEHQLSLDDFPKSPTAAFHEDQLGHKQTRWKSLFE